MTDATTSLPSDQARLWALEYAVAGLVAQHQSLSSLQKAIEDISQAEAVLDQPSGVVFLPSAVTEEAMAAARFQSAVARLMRMAIDRHAEVSG